MTSAVEHPAVLLLSIVVLLGAAHLAVGADREPVVMLSPGNPLVSFRFVFHVGSSDDPAGKEGLAALTAMMLSQGGTEELSLAEVMERLYPLAAGVSARADKEVTTLEGRAHRDHLDAFYSIFRDRLQSPRFDPADFERNKRELLNTLTQSLRSADEERLGKAALEQALYDGHPYGHPVQGTVFGLASITLEDVKRFYRERYTFENLQIGLAGDLPAGFAPRVAEDFRSALPSGSPPKHDLPDVERRKGLDVLIVDKPAADSTAISIGAPLSITRIDADFYPLLVANTFLGDHRTFNGVLMNELRAKRGLNYGDYSYIESFLQDGGSTFVLPNIPRRQQHFSIWIRPVAPENALFAVRAALFYLRRLVDRGMSEEQFRETRDYLVSYSKLWVQSLDRRLGFRLDASFYQTGFLIDEIEQRLKAMTVDEVNRAVKKHLDRWDFRVALVARNASELAAAIEASAKSPVTYPTEGTPEAVLAEDRLIEALPLPVERLRVVPVGELFEK